MRKSLLIGGGVIAAITIVITAIVLSGVIEQEEELVLSNYPKLFEKDVVIVIGENATQMEYESAEAIAANLENLTGNKPKVYISEKTESLKYTYNLIILGTPNSNDVLKEVCKMANVTRVMDEYPGEGKGILEILKNPWNEDKAILLVAGSDERGVKAGSMELEQKLELNNASVVVEWKESEANKMLKYTWFNGDQEKQVFAALDEVAIFPKSVSETTNVTEELVKNFDQQAILIKDYEFVILVRLPPNRLDITTLEDKQDKFQNTTGNIANFVFYLGPEKDQAPMALTGDIIVHFRQDWDEDRIAEWAKGMSLETIESFPFSPNTYLFKAGPGLRSLDMANQIYLSGEVIYAYPNWWKATELKSNQVIPTDSDNIMQRRK